MLQVIEEGVDWLKDECIQVQLLIYLGVEKEKEKISQENRNSRT